MDAYRFYFNVSTYHSIELAFSFGFYLNRFCCFRANPCSHLGDGNRVEAAGQRIMRAWSSKVIPQLQVCECCLSATHGLGPVSPSLSLACTE